MQEREGPFHHEPLASGGFQIVLAENERELFRAFPKERDVFKRLGEFKLVSPLDTIYVGTKGHPRYFGGEITLDMAAFDGDTENNQKDRTISNNLIEKLHKFTSQFGEVGTRFNSTGNEHSFNFERNHVPLFIRIDNGFESQKPSVYVGTSLVDYMGHLEDYQYRGSSPSIYRSTVDYTDSLHYAFFLSRLNAFKETFSLIVDEVYRYFNVSTPNIRLLISSAHESSINQRIVPSENIIFNDIGGYEEQKAILKNLASAIQNPEHFNKWGTKAPKGILLHGPPGTGKTLLARALANEAGTPFFPVEVSDITTKWFGESEQNLKAVFNHANSLGVPSVIFFDEIDALGQNRSGSDSGAQNRILTTLLENLDGFPANDLVTVVASTNRLEAMDSALLRPGRFDRKVHIPLPDYESRRQILEVHLEKAETLAQRILFERGELSQAVDRLEGFSGADMAEIVRRVLEKKVTEEINFGHVISNFVSPADIMYEVSTYEKDPMS